jgi:serine/threonine protein kinase
MSGIKFSSGYIPPELVYCDEEDVFVRSPVSLEENFHRRGLNISFVPASPAHDLWSLGALFYFIAVNAPLFHCDNDGNIVDSEDLRTLAEWADSVKLQKLYSVKNSYLRNLISQLLSLDPQKRPNMANVMSHPFMTGRIATRLSGDEADFDVFISYRVGSDSLEAEALYNALVDRGVRVWWDQKSLLPGEPWDQKFCEGLAKSRIIAPLLSRAAMKSPTNPRQNLETLHESSPCDNVLLEHRLALELRDRGLIEKIFPLFIGDKKEDGTTYTRYLFNGSDSNYPACPEEVLQSLELKLKSELEILGLGLPFEESMTIAKIEAEITRYQGYFIEGEMELCMANVATKVHDMLGTAPVPIPFKRLL